MRLIDAEAFYNQVLRMGLFDNQDRDIFLDAIDAQPTAYNVRRVIEELKENQCEAQCGTSPYEGYDNYYQGELNAYTDAINIVNRGGVDD